MWHYFKFMGLCFWFGSSALIMLCSSINSTLLPRLFFPCTSDFRGRGGWKNTNKTKQINPTKQNQTNNKTTQTTTQQPTPNRQIYTQQSTFSLYDIHLDKTILLNLSQSVLTHKKHTKPSHLPDLKRIAVYI